MSDDPKRGRRQPPNTMADFPPRPVRPAGGAGPASHTRGAQQRRRAARIRVGLPLRIRRERQANISEDHCYDLAPNGMFIETVRTLTVGDVLRFECDYGGDHAFAGLGRVMWIRTGEDARGPRGVGVSFVGLDPRGELVIRAILAEHGESGVHPERDAISVLPSPPGASAPARAALDRAGRMLGKGTLLGAAGVSQAPSAAPGAPQAPSLAHDQRASLRAPLSLDMRYCSEALRVERGAVCENLSEKGMFLAAEEPLAVGTAVRVHCAVGCAQHAIEGSGRVLWRRTRATGDGRPAGMAIAFTELSEQSAQVIDEVLRAARPSQLPPAPLHSDVQADEAEPGELPAGAVVAGREALAPDAPRPPAPAPPDAGFLGAAVAQPIVPLSGAPVRPRPTIPVEDSREHAHTNASEAGGTRAMPSQGPVPSLRPSDPLLREQRLREMIALQAEHGDPALGRSSRHSSATRRSSIPLPPLAAGLGVARRVLIGLGILALAWLLGRAIAVVL